MKNGVTPAPVSFFFTGRSIGSAGKFSFKEYPTVRSADLPGCSFFSLSAISPENNSFSPSGQGEQIAALSFLFTC